MAYRLVVHPKLPLGLRRLFREPLVHFVLLGALLFALERTFARRAPSEGGPSEGGWHGDTRIVADAEVRATLAQGWESTHRRPPNQEELDKLVARWIDDELLYREGLKRGLERDDARVRERIATKMAFVLEAQILVPDPPDAELLAWFDQHADRWAKSELVDFTHVFVTGDDETARSRANDLLTRLTSGAEPTGLGDSFSGGRRYRRRKIPDLAQSFGDPFVVGMAEQPEGSWVLRRSRFGYHVVRIDRRTPAQAPDFGSVKLDVRKDWEAARRTEEYEKAMAALRARWEIVKEP